jgi:predicted dehydrogenase
MTKFGVGVIGATGYIGMPYRAEIRESPEDATIVALCARRRELLEAAGREDGASLISEDWRDIVEHPQVDLVVVASPDRLHYEMVMTCAAAGKHVVCEKPVAMNAAEAQAMWLAYRDRRLGHFVPFWTRYVPIFGRARQLVQQGLLGDIKLLVYRWHNPRPPDMPFTWRDDAEISAAGSLADVGSHACDTLCWLLDQQPLRVLAHAGILTPAKPDLGAINLQEALQSTESPAPPSHVPRKQATAFDFAQLALELDRGTVGTIVLSHATFVRKGLAPEVELHGTEASLAIDRLQSRLLLARPGASSAEVLEAVADTGWGNRFANYVFPAIRERMTSGRSEHPGLDDGYHVQRFTDAAVLSAREGRWVKLAAS